MFVLKRNNMVFRGYGTTMSQPLWGSVDRLTFVATLFRSEDDARLERDSLFDVFRINGIEIVDVTTL